MNALTFQIHLLEPVLVTQLGGGDPNSAVGFNFIPGSVIRGALIAKHLHGAKGDATDADFRRLFFDGTVRFLNAYPRFQTGERMLPTPLSWHVEKDTEEPVYDFAIIDDRDLKDDESNKVWKVVNEPFCWIWDDDEGKQQTEFYNPVTQIKIHTARADRQNVTEEGSTIFRYLALDSGQDFAGVVLADNSSDIDCIKDILAENPILGFGKSHLAGYGRVKIDTVKPVEGWKEYNPTDDGMGGNIVVALLSDAIVRDRKTGAHVASIEQALVRTRGLKDHSNSDIRPDLKKAFVHTRVRGGFNRTWNLPLPQTLAIRAGSVFVYEADPVLRNCLETLELSGIGEKREEGFGRIAVDWSWAGKINVEPPVPSNPPASFKLEGESAELTLIIVNRMMRANLDQALVKKINELSLDRKGMHNAQLSRMRVITRRAWSENDAGLILQHLGGMEKKPAERQFKNATIDGESLYKWLEERAGKPNSIRGLLSEGFDKTPSVGGITPDMTDDLALEYTMRLIDGVLHKAIKLEEANK
ncbi:MAG: hypothetical protein C4B59_12125 [Candidatus Methanogaster sp.]|uniref:Uncharacterized protein n=1 Tax=Candidatus Methanogaster sp. TaxID=3386292 RepID=A0AC61L0E7_9EURY|nr:MAG: hypothetical protein C4B59_12125 [ANME-2 cluster archaeon]